VRNALGALAGIANRPEAWEFADCDRVFAGVDIGTHSVVAVLVDERGRPRAMTLRRAEVVRSGLIVDYVGAQSIVCEMVEELRARCPLPVELGATTYPPNTEQGNINTTTHILNSAGLEVVRVLDEPTAANRVLRLEHGAIVDVGGGTTGIAVIEGGEVVYSADEATGGVHLTLVLAGGLKIEFEDAERLKADKSQARKVLGIVRPVVDKISSIVERHLADWPDVKTLYLVGGTCELEGLSEAVSANTRRKTLRPAFPQAVTPLGVALSCWEAAGEADGKRAAGG
jgi:ethanolamine utilization protein EutJ